MTRFSVKLSNILGLSYYRYELTSSTYNPTIDTAFTITVKVTDVFGNNVSGKSVTLYHDGTSVSSQTTNSNGVATWTITPTEWGTHDFNVSNTHCQVQVDGWRWTQNETTWQIGRNADHGILILKGWSSNAPTSWKQFGGQGYAYDFRPIANTYQQNDRVIWIVNAENGTISLKSTTGSAINTTTWYGQIEWAINQ